MIAERKYLEMLLVLIDGYSKAYPDVSPELAAARVAVKRHLRRLLRRFDADTAREQYNCECGFIFWANEGQTARCPICTRYIDRNLAGASFGEER